MPRYSEFRCTKCGKRKEKELLLAKSVVFAKIGTGGRVIQSRTTAWICDECLPGDEDWNRPAFKSPGMISPGKARVEELKAKGKTDGV